MNFAWPQVLLLLVLPVGWLAWEAARGRVSGINARPHILRADAGPHSVRLADRSELPFLSAGRSGPRLWLAAGLALAIVALARPQWGRIDEPVFDQSREVLIAIDLSRSMLTPDVTPSRLERAKLLVQSLLERLGGERVGLVAFSGTAFLQSPLSADYEILREFLPSLGPDFMPVGGTNYGALMETAATAFSSGPGSDRYLIVLSDGGATDDDWRSHIPALTSRGIRVIGLGIGTAKGALIPDGAGGYLKDENGGVVMSKLESDTLRELSAKTNGVYRDGSEWVDLAQLLKTTVEAGRKGQFVERNSIRYAERFQWALAPALVCLLISFWREFPVRPKPRDLRPRETVRAAGRSAAAALLCLLTLGFAPAVRAAAEPAAPPTAPGVILGRMVGRLSGEDQRSAIDWSELADQTITWGRQLQSSSEAVPEGPVRDGLAAVDAGAAMDPKAADWGKLRAQLEDMLKKSEDRKQKQQQQQKQQQDQQQKKQQNQNQRQQNSSGSPQQQQSQPQNQSGQPSNPQNSAPEQQSAFGDIKGRQPPPQSGDQQVGGRPENKRPDPAEADPALAAPLQKLDQLRDQDAPAELFQMIENNEPHPTDTKGKNW